MISEHPLIVPVIAAIIIDLFFFPGMALFCENWKHELPPSPTPSPAPGPTPTPPAGV